MVLYYENKSDNIWIKLNHLLNFYFHPLIIQRLILFLAKKNDFQQHLNQPFLRLTYFSVHITNKTYQHMIDIFIKIGSC